MITVNNVKLPLDTDFENLVPIAARCIKAPESDIISARLYKKSVDARKKNGLHFCVSLIISAKNEKAALRLKNVSPFHENKYVYKKADIIPEKRPVIVGFGPAGMFAALTLARAGLCPLVIERGCDVDTRTKDIDKFFSGGELKENSNVQFGEGGAGTFSDGKLNTGIKDNRCRNVLEELVRFGANEDILYDAKPHIGTDILRNTVKNIRKEIISLGGEVRFSAKLDGVFSENGRLTEISVNGEKIKTDIAVLACGHSARDTFKMIKEAGADMCRKPFSVGVRIEHLQSEINKALYGDFSDSPYLPPASYKMAVHLENGRGVYTFCMCPGGYVINSSSEKGALAVNGMSENSRNGKNANSALLVGVEPEDFEGDDVLAGCAFQEKIEKAAYNLARGSVPADTVGHFVFGKTAEIGEVLPTVKPSYTLCDFEKIFPSFVTSSLKDGIKAFGRKISGFDSESAVLTAPETRSSSPVRIIRGEDGSSNIKGIYPAGEGAGYAGGIMSAAVDGIKTAEKIIELFVSI